ASTSSQIALLSRLYPKRRTGGGDKLEACPTSESIAGCRLAHWPWGRFPHRSRYTLKQSWGKNEIRIGKSAHLRSIQAGYLGLSRNPNAQNLVLNLEEGVECSEYENDVDGDSYTLGQKLFGRAVEQPRHCAGNSIEAIPILSVGEQP